MSALKQIRALIQYNEWANGHVFESAARLSEDELGRTLGASFGSVRGNLEHTLWAQELWLGRWRGTASAPDQPPSDLGALRAAYDTSHGGISAFAAQLEESGLSRVLSYVDTKDVSQERPLWQAMLHMVNHGTHHRAESALLLTSLGQPPRQLDYIFFELERA